MSGSMNWMSGWSSGYIGMTCRAGFRIGFNIVLPLPIRTRIFNILMKTYFFHKIKTLWNFFGKIGVLDGGGGERGEFGWIFGGLGLRRVYV